MQMADPDLLFAEHLEKHMKQTGSGSESSFAIPFDPLLFVTIQQLKKLIFMLNLIHKWK